MKIYALSLGSMDGMVHSANRCIYFLQTSCIVILNVYCVPKWVVCFCVSTIAVTPTVFSHITSSHTEMGHKSITTKLCVKLEHPALKVCALTYIPVSYTHLDVYKRQVVH